MVRYNGFDYLHDIVDFIKSKPFHFNILGIYGIKWAQSERKAKLNELYNNQVLDKDKFTDILDRNKNVLIGIICLDRRPKKSTPDTHSDNHNTVIVKRHFRDMYGNILHVSDTEELAYKEIRLTLGFNINIVNSMKYNRCPGIGQCKSGDELIKTFNKIEDGRVVLWKP